MIMSELQLTLVAEGLKFPEGPVAMSDGSVILTEIEGKRVVRVAPEGKINVVAEVGGGPHGLAVGPDGALYVTNNGGAYQFFVHDGVNIPGPAPSDHKGGSIQRVDLKTGVLTTLYTHCGDRRLHAPNDLVFDKGGGFWFTDYGTGYATYKVYGGLFYATPDGTSISCARDGLLSPNGVGLSPDEKTVCVADTLTGRLWAFDVKVPGQLTAQFAPAFPGRVVHTLPGYQFVDSLAVEASGTVCVATMVNGGISAFAPDGTVEHFAVPDLLVSNICFGGDDMRDAWITASGTGRLYKTRWPRPGLKLNFNA
jgi:gluconolactonase